MKIALVKSTHAEPIAPLLEEFGFEIVEVNPEFVISHGGDGTILDSEHRWPGVPKIILRGSPICKRCGKLTNEEILAAVIKGDYRIVEYMKLEAVVNGKKLFGLNDIVIRNQDPRHAVRYHFSKDGEPVGHEIIGDGLVISTPFGSSGYFRSITDAIFEVGIGVAFNNSTEAIDHLVLAEDKVLRMKINRGHALAYADNQGEFVELLPGDEAIIKKSDHVARLVHVD